MCYGRRFSTSAAARPPRTTGAAPPVGAGGTRGSRFFGFCARSAIVQRRAKHHWSRDSAPGLKSRRQTPCKGYLRAERTEKRGLSRIQFYRVELKWKPIVKYTAFCCLRIVCRSSSSCEFQFAQYSLLRGWLRLEGGTHPLRSHRSLIQWAPWES